MGGQFVRLNFTWFCLETLGLICVYKVEITAQWHSHLVGSRPIGEFSCVIRMEWVMVRGIAGRLKAVSIGCSNIVRERIQIPCVVAYS